MTDSISKIIAELRNTDMDDPWCACEERRDWANRLEALEGYDGTTITKPPSERAGVHLAAMTRQKD